MPICVQKNRDFKRVKLKNKVDPIITLLKVFPEISDFTGFWFLALGSLCLFFKGFKASNTSFSLLYDSAILYFHYTSHIIQVYLIWCLFFHPNVTRQDLETHLNNMVGDKVNNNDFCSYLGWKEIRRPMCKYTIRGRKKGRGRRREGRGKRKRRREGKDREGKERGNGGGNYRVLNTYSAPGMVPDLLRLTNL